MESKCDIAFLSMEMLMPEELPPPVRDANFRGGLGILAGDIMAGLGRVGISAIGVIPLYNRSWVDSREISYDNLPVQCVMELNPVINGQPTPIEVLEINRAGTPVFGLISKSFNYLYVHDRWDRLQQEKLLGKAAPLLLERLGINPNIIWLNESHTSVALADIKERSFFKGAKSLFTIHTPDPAGMENFPGHWFDELEIDRFYFNFLLKVNGNYKFIEKYYPVFVNNGTINFTQAAMSLADMVNAVSYEHFCGVKETFPEFASKMLGIRNGSDRETWLSPRLREKERVNSSALWRIHQEDKKDLLNLIRNLTGISLSLRKPLIVWVRRIVPYKNQYPMLEQIIKAICADRGEKVETPFGRLPGLGMQMFCAGIPSYGDGYCHGWVEAFNAWMQDPQLQGRFVFLHDYSFDLLKEGAAGCDIWFSGPRPGWEACGTGDQRATINGNINLTTRTGGAIEYIEEVEPESCQGNGFFIDPYDPFTVYSKLGIMSGLHYDWTESGNRIWPELRMNAFRSGKALDIVPMIEQYRERIFEPLLKSS
jgi:starch phosphorylase